MIPVTTVSLIGNIIKVCYDGKRVYSYIGHEYLYRKLNALENKKNYRAMAKLLAGLELA